MQAEFMMVNLNELVIDMPVDEANVQQKMESLQANGVIQPVTVWLQGMRIIDGFHRTVAAQRLGWTEVPCNVIDCGEEAFWDARIQSAKQHHAISKERLSAWIVESWKLSEWYQPVDADQVRRDYERFGHSIMIENDESALARFSAAQAVWNMEFRERVPTGSKQEPNSFGRRGILITQIYEDHELSTAELWFRDKAIKWGVTGRDIADMLLDALGYGASNPDLKLIDNALKMDRRINFSERIAIVQQAPRSDVADIRSQGSPIRKWIDDVKEDKTNLTLTQYRSQMERIESIERAAKQAEARKSHEAQAEQRRLYAESPAGQAEIAKRKAEVIRGKIDSMENVLDFIDKPYPIADIPEAATMLTEFVLSVEAKIKSAFPEYRLTSKANPILAANVELRKKIAEQEDRIASLERALNSKSMVSKNVVAMASEEMERLTQ